MADLTTDASARTVLNGESDTPLTRKESDLIWVPTSNAGHVAKHKAWRWTMSGGGYRRAIRVVTRSGCGLGTSSL